MDRDCHQSPRPAVAPLTALYLLAHLVAEHPGWSENQDQDQDAEDHRLAPARVDVEIAGRGDHADDQAPQLRPREVADASKYRRREGHQASPEALLKPRRVVVEPRE